jgi:putative transposase
MTKTKSLYHGHRFPASIISHAVRWYFRFQLSLRDIEELLFERGVTVRYETIRRWREKFGAGFAHRVKVARCKSGSTWHLDEMFITLRGEPYLLWRAVDEHGVELDILLQKRRDKSAAKRFFKRVLRSNPVPRKIVTDQLRSYPAAKADIPERVNVKHVFVSCGPCQQPCREQASAHAGARAAHARLSRPEAHAGFPVELRSDPSALRTETTSAARFSLSQTPYGPVRRTARIYQRHPNSVDCFLSHSALCINIDEVPQVDNAPDATKESLRALPEFKYAPD